MTAKASHRSASDDAEAAEIYDAMHNSIAHQLQHGLFERLDTDYLHGAITNLPQISGAIFLSLHPKHGPYSPCWLTQCNVRPG